MEWYRSRWFYACLILLMANLVVLAGVTPLGMDAVYGQQEGNPNKSCNDSDPCVECEWQRDAEGHRVQVQVASEKDPKCGSCDGKDFVQDCSESTCTDCNLCSDEDADKPGGLTDCQECDKGEVQKLECGTVNGTQCGSCEGEKKVCDQETYTCYKPCDTEGVQCGTVEGVQCKNECDDMENKICNEETNSCYDPCKDAECGTVDGVSCDNECADQEGQVCDTETNQCVSSDSGNGDDGGSGDGSSGNDGSDDGSSGGDGNGDDGPDDDDDCEPDEECPPNACGTIDDGCDGTLECGGCGDNHKCNDDECEFACKEEKNYLNKLKDTEKKIDKSISEVGEDIAVFQSAIEKLNNFKHEVTNEFKEVVDKCSSSQNPFVVGMCGGHSFANSGMFIDKANNTIDNIGQDLEDKLGKLEELLNKAIEIDEEKKSARKKLDSCLKKN